MRRKSRTTESAAQSGRSREGRGNTQHIGDGRKRQFALLVGAALSGALLAWQPVAAQVSYEFVAENETINGAILDALLDNNGDVAFSANADGTASVFVFSGGAPSTLVGENTLVPGFDDEVFGLFGSNFKLLQTPDGNRFFLAGIVSPTFSPTPVEFTFALFTHSASGTLALHMDAREFAAPLGIDPEGAFLGFFPLRVLAFSATAADAVYVTAEKFGVASGLFVVDAGATPTLLLQQGASLPGINGPTVARISTDKDTGQELSDSGRFAANASGKAIGIFRLEGDGVTTANDEAVVLLSGGGVTALAREGDPVPGGGANFGSFGSVGVNAGGDLVFADATRIYTGTSDSDLSVAITNGVDAASHKARSVVIADDGAIFFLSTDTLSLYKLKDGLIQTLATRNDDIPGSGVVLDRFLGDVIAISADGKLAAPAILGGEVTTANDDALLAFDGKGKLALLARQGTPILLPDGMGGETAFEIPSLLGNTSINSNNQFLISTGPGTRRLFIATVDAFLATGPVFVWNGDCGDTNWHADCPPVTNWEDENGVAHSAPPGANGDETVRIAVADVDIADAAASVGSLQATGSLKVTSSLTVNAASSIENLILDGDLAANGALTLSGMGNLWISGAIGGGPLAPVTLDAGSNLRIEADNVVELDTLLNVEGALRHEKGSLTLGTEANFGRIEVLPGGEYRIESGGIVDDTGGNALVTLDGTLRKTTAGSATIGVPVVSLNEGAAIAVEGGSLTLTAGGQHRAAHTVAGGASLALQGGTTRVTGPLTVTGDGTMRVTGGTYRIEDDASADFDLALAGDGLEVTATTIEAEGLLENKGRALLDGVSLNGTTEAGGLTNRGNLIFQGAMATLAAPLRNEEEGLVLQEVNIEIPEGQGDGMVTNQGTFVIGADEDVFFTDLNSFTTSRFANEQNATLKKVGTGNTQIFAGFENKGNVVVEAGTLELKKTAFATPTAIGSIADITVNAGASLVFANSPFDDPTDHSFEGDFDILGEGTVRFGEETGVGLTGTLTNKGATMELQAKSIACKTVECFFGPNAQIINDSGLLRIGTDQFVLRLEAVDLVNLPGAEVVQSRTVGVESGSPGMRFVNGGTWTLKPVTDGPLSVMGGFPDRFINTGVLIIEGNTDASTTFGNTGFFASDEGVAGTVEVLEDGRLAISQPDAATTFSSGALRDGNWIVNPNSLILLSGPIDTIAEPASVTIRGKPADPFAKDGEIAGLPDVEGDFTNEGTLRLEGATFHTGSSFTNERGASLQLAPGILNIEGPAGLRNRGRIFGIGVINGEAINDGAFDIGPSPAAITVNGNYTQGAEGTLTLRPGSGLQANARWEGTQGMIPLAGQGGAAAGTRTPLSPPGPAATSRPLEEGDPLLAVTGVATLDGTLRLAIEGVSDLPAPGSMGVLIQAGTIEGTFDWIDQHDMGRQRRYRIEVMGTEMTATAEAISIRTYADWRALVFPESEVENDIVAGPSADPDQDGLENFEEYIHGTHPLRPSQPPVRVSAEGDPVSGTAVYRVEFPWDDNLVDAAWRLQFSSDLEAWTDVEGTLVSLEESGDFTIRSLEYRSVVPMAEKGFVRLVAAPITGGGQ